MNTLINLARLAAVSVLAVTGAIIGATAAPPDQPSAEIVKQGQNIAEKNCARCHAIGRDGTSTHKEAPPFRDVVKRYPVWSLAESLAEGISTGHADMPEFKFNPEQITSLLSYMETLEEKSSSPTGN